MRNVQQLCNLFGDEVCFVCLRNRNPVKHHTDKTICSILPQRFEIDSFTKDAFSRGCFQTFLQLCVDALITSNTEGNRGIKSPIHYQ